MLHIPIKGTGGDDERPLDPLTANARAMQARDEALVKHGMKGEPTVAYCSLAPGTERILVQRIGPVGVPTTNVGVALESRGKGALAVSLSPVDARRIAVALMDAADEADGLDRIAIHVPDSPRDLTD